MKKIINISAQAPALALAFALLLCSCGGPKTGDEANAAKADFAAEKNLVDTMTLRKAGFYKEIVSNGTLKGAKKAELRFATQGEIARVFVKNGSRVSKGDSIAVLDTRQLRMSLNKSAQSLEKAKLEFYDVLIGFGYTSDTTEVPQDIMDVSKIRSGYGAAIQDYTSARMNLENAAVVAPFSGVVANLTAKPYEKSGESVCLVIDDSSFDVEFNLLESELSYISVGQKIRISPFVELTESYNGTISEINPLVDEKGCIKVVARISNSSRKLIEGMNVKVFIESRTENSLTVPKSAVVIRDGYDVLFTFDPESGKAGWVYVDVLQSNSTHHVVQGNEKKNAILNEGQIIIISGNLNLADGSKVEVKTN